MRYICNKTCNYLKNFLQPLILWLCGWVGIAVLPDGCRAIPAGHFNFDPEVVERLGRDKRDSVARAIIFERIHGWLLYNEAHGRNRRDGRIWSYNDYPHWAQEARFWHETTIGRHIRAIEAAGLLTSMQPSPIHPKHYSLPAKESIGATQMPLWAEQKSLSGGAKESATTDKQALHKPSRKKPQTTANTRTIAAGAVASFQTPRENRELPENAPSTVEVRPSSNEGNYALALEGAPDMANASQTSPSSAPPPPPAQRFHADIRGFWPTCEAEPALRDLIAGRDEAHTLAVIRYAQTQKCDSPKGLARTLLAQGFMPPGYAPQTLPTEVSNPGDLPPITWSDDETEPDEDTTKPADEPQIEPEALMAWNTAYGQLEVQLDRASFDTWLRGAWLYRLEGNKFIIGVSNSYARDMLQHRMYRDIARVMNEVYGQPVELVFEVQKQPRPEQEMPLPLFKLLAQSPDVQPEWKGNVA